MATFTITNLTADPVHLGDFYLTIEAGATATIANRTVDELPSLVSVQQNVAAGNILFTVTPSAAELASDMMTPPDSVTGNDTQEVASTALLALCPLIRKGFAAGVAGTPDDVTVYAVGALPYKFRLVNAWALIATAVGGSTLSLYDKAGGAGGGGTLLGVLDSATTGYKSLSGVNASVVATPSATTGLFVYRSDRGVAGEMFALVRRES